LDSLQAELLEAVKEVLRTGELSSIHNKGIIALIPKGGDATLIKNFRPVTLLSSFYKLVAKVLAWRLQKILPEVVEVVRLNQTGFVPACASLTIFFSTRSNALLRGVWTKPCTIIIGF